MVIHNKDDIDFLTEFPCFLGHPVEREKIIKFIEKQIILICFPGKSLGTEITFGFKNHYTLHLVFYLIFEANLWHSYNTLYTDKWLLSLFFL